MRQEAIDHFFDILLKAFLENNYPFFFFGHSNKITDEDEEFNRCVDLYKETLGLHPDDY